MGLKVGATIAGQGLVVCRVAPASSSYVGGAPPGEQVASQLMVVKYAPIPVNAGGVFVSLNTWAWESMLSEPLEATLA